FEYVLNSRAGAGNIRLPRTMKHRWIFLPLLAVVGCAAPKPHPSTATSIDFGKELRALEQRFAPDFHLAVYDVTFTARGKELILSGEVDRDEARMETVRAAQQTGAKVTDQIRVLPAAELGETN